jgi:ssDNA-binding Zn-finger/Zn-ribbon topoisomerase 1
MICKKCGREIMEMAKQGVGELYHCVDFDDCKPEPLEKAYADTTLEQCYEGGYYAGISGDHPEDREDRFFSSPDRIEAWRRGKKLAEKSLWKTDRIYHWCPKCKEYFGLLPGKEKICERCDTKLIREYKKHTKRTKQ